jgi:hypothetical protein
MNFKEVFTNRKWTKLSIVLVFLSALIAVGFIMANRPTYVLAEAADLALVRAQYPVMKGLRIDSCNLCHNSIPGLNSYGAAYKSSGRNQTALVDIQNQDSDGDGWTNIQEIIALTFPGNPNDHPGANTATFTPTVAPSPTWTPTPIAIPKGDNKLYLPFIIR